MSDSIMNGPGNSLNGEKSGQQESGISSQDEQNQPKCVGLEDFYVGLDTLESLLFREELEIVLQSDPQAVSGTFTISVEKVEGKEHEPPFSLLIHISGRATMDDVLECSTSITSCITPQLLTIQENRLECTQLDIGDKRQQMFLGCEGNQYCCVTEMHVNTELLSRNTKEIPREQAQDLISEGANVILLRQMALKGFVGELLVNTILVDGRICPSKYMCDGSSVISRDGEELTVYVIKRVVQESCDEEQTLMSTLTCAGQLMEHEWVGGLCLVRGTAYRQETGNPTLWEEDMELTSCYLDHKMHQVALHKSYLVEKPEMKTLIADFVQAVLLLKPDDVIQFAVGYFSMFVPDACEVNNYDTALEMMSELMNLVMKNITEKEMVDLMEELVKMALQRVESHDMLHSLQTMIESTGKLLETFNLILNFFLEEADEGVVSGCLALILRSAVEHEGEAEVLQVLSRVANTDKERELVSSMVRSADSEHVVAGLMEKLLISTTDTVQEEGSQMVPEIVEDIMSTLESRQIADTIILELIERATQEEM